MAFLSGLRVHELTAGDRVAGGGLPRADRGRGRVPGGAGMRGAVPFRALLRSEWTKLRSIRSTWWCTALYLLVVGGTGWLAAASTELGPAVRRRAGRGAHRLRDRAARRPRARGAGGDHRVRVRHGAGLADRRAPAHAAAGWPRRSSSPCTAPCSPPSSSVVCAAAAFTLTDVPGGLALTSPEVLRPMGLQVASTVRWWRSSPSRSARCSGRPPGRWASGRRWCSSCRRRWRCGGRSSPCGPPRRCRRCGWGRTPSPRSATTWPVGLAIVAGWAVVAWLLGAVLLERRDV